LNIYNLQKNAFGKHRSYIAVYTITLVPFHFDFVVFSQISYNRLYWTNYHIKGGMDLTENHQSEAPKKKISLQEAMKAQLESKKNQATR